jgi:hypothetical protein
MDIKNIIRLINKGLWYITTKKCPQCHGSGRIYGSANPPSWTTHGRFLKIKGICGICHSYGRVPLFDIKKKISLEDLKTIKIKVYKSRRMPWIPKR